MASILIVDDDKDFLRIVQKVLSVGGYGVVAATDAMDALERVQREIFDLILTDANMPGGSGFDLVKTLRKNPSTSQMIIAMVTGRRDKEDVNRGLQCGADDYITKPIDPDLFLAKIQSLLASKTNDRPAISFAESPVRMAAKWDVISEIASISEQGLTLWSQISGTPNSKFIVASELFDKIKIEVPTLRVVSCTQDPTHPNMFFTTVSFVGLTETERQKIRFWINSNLGAMKEKKAV